MMFKNKFKLGIIMLTLSCLTIFLLACSGQVPAEEDNIKTEPVATITAEDVEEPGIKSVVIENFKFNPVDLDVKVGDTVEWTNLGDVEHTVTFENGDFDQEIGVGGTLTYTFTEAGIYRYFCLYHPGMQGTVNVE